MCVCRGGGHALGTLMGEGWGGGDMPLAVGLQHSWSGVWGSRGVGIDMRSYNRVLRVEGSEVREGERWGGGERERERERRREAELAGCLLRIYT